MSHPQSVAVAHLVPDAHGARLVSLEGWQGAELADLDDHLSGAWVQRLLDLATTQMGPLSQAPRCVECASPAPTAFLTLIVWIKAHSDGTFVAEQGAHPRWCCLNCGKYSHAPDRTPISAHAVLPILAATRRQAPLFFGHTFLPERPDHV